MALVISAALFSAAILRGHTASPMSPTGQSQQTSPAAPAGLSLETTLSGRIVDGSTGAPLAGAMISLVAPSSTAMVPATGNVVTSEFQRLSAVDRQVADRNGRFLFRDLTPGRLYQVWAAKPGYLAGAWGMSDTRPIPARVVLEPGQPTADLTVRLWTANAISGTVLDEAGEPVVGVFVGVAMRILVAGIERFATGPFTRTDDRGAYRVAPLVPGTYMVVVPSIQFSTSAELPVLQPVDPLTAMDPRAPVGYLPDGRVTARLPTLVPGLMPGQHAMQAGEAGYLVRGPGSLPPAPPSADGQRQNYPPTFYPTARSIDQAEPIRLDRGAERRGVNVFLRPVPVFRVSGVLEAPDGQTASRRLRLVSPGAEDLGAGYETATAFAAPNGRFTFLDVPEGRYTIIPGPSTSYGYQPPGAVVQPALRSLAALTGGSPMSLGGAGNSASEVVFVPGLAPSDAPATIRKIVEGGQATPRVAGMPVVVAGADQEDVYVQVGPRVSISGRLVIETPQDRAALEIRASTLGIVAESGDAIGSGARATAPITGSLLDFRMGGLLSGNYVLRMFGGTGFIKSITLGGREYAGLPIRVAGDLSGVVVTVTSRTATLTGAVTEPDGSAASHAAVICFPTDAARWRGYGPSPDRLHGVPARNGRYEISLPGGEYFLIAVDAGLTDIWKDPAFLATAATRATRATVAWGDTTTRDLTRQEVEP